MIAVRQLFDLPASGSSKFHATAHVCRGEGGEIGATDKLLDVFDQVLAKRLPGTVIVNASAGFAAVSCCANPEWFAGCAPCGLVRYHWTNAALVLWVCCCRGSLTC